MRAMWLILGFIAQTSADGKPLAEVLGRHEQYLDRIHTLDATIEVWESTDGGATWSLTMRERWVKDGLRERSTTWARGFLDQSGVYREKQVRYDTSFSEAETRHLQGWDHEHPPAEAPSPANRYHGATAHISGPSRNESVSGSPPLLVMLAPTLESYLPGAVRSGSNVSLERATFNGRDCWEVRFDAKLGVPATYRVTLDPTRGYAMVRHNVQTRTSDPRRGVSEVVEFREIEDGLFIPVRIRAFSPEEPKKIQERRVTQLKVNEPVPAEALMVRFPENMGVADSRTGVFSIWGTDGPKLVLDTPEKHQEYMRSFFGRKPASPIGWFLGVTGASVVTVALLLVLRRRLRQIS